MESRLLFFTPEWFKFASPIKEMGVTIIPGFRVLSNVPAPSIMICLPIRGIQISANMMLLIMLHPLKFTCWLASHIGPRRPCVPHAPPCEHYMRMIFNRIACQFVLSQVWWASTPSVVCRDAYVPRQVAIILVALLRSSCGALIT